MINAARYVDQRKQRKAQAHGLMGFLAAGTVLEVVVMGDALQQAAAGRSEPVFA